jgi:hypothetical protein
MAIQVGVPGASAAREHQRRRAKDRADANRELPVRLVIIAFIAIAAYVGVQILAGFINHGSGLQHTAARAKPAFPPTTAHGLGIIFAIVLAVAVASKLWTRKQTTEAWVKGAQGERQVAAQLAKLVPKGVGLIHDRGIPGTRANIDHIAIGPSGIFILDAKNTSGKVETRTTGPLFRRGPTQLFVRGRNRTNFIDGMEKQIIAVRMALAGLPEAHSVPIHPMVVIVGGQWGLFARSLNVRGVWVGWGKEASKYVSRPGPLSPDAISRLTTAIASALPAA